MIKSHRDRRLLQCTVHADTVHGYPTGVQFTGHYNLSSKIPFIGKRIRGESVCRESNRLFNTQVAAHFPHNILTKGVETISAHRNGS